MSLCASCRGRGWCGKVCPILSRINFLKEKIDNVGESFFGASPPSIFVGKFQYPNVFTGILAPAQEKDTAILDDPEGWYKKDFRIEDVLKLRSQLIYSRFKANVRSQREKILDVQKELVKSIKPVDVEIDLKTKPRTNISFDLSAAPIIRPAEVKNVKITENVQIPKIVEKVVSDFDLKSFSAINKLYENKFSVNTISKILSAGLLGSKIERKMVPTRWSITAVDDNIGLKMLEKIKEYQEISEYLLFSNTYLGNHYEILLIPRQWSYELIEMKLPGSEWNYDSSDISIMRDYEGFHKRKEYAFETAGGYYAARLGVCEYLDKIKRQASVFILREVTSEYYAPLGVWVPRETVRGAFEKEPARFSGLMEALIEMKRRMRVNVSNILRESKLLNEIRVQRTLKSFVR